MKRFVLLWLVMPAVLGGIFIVACEKHKDPFSAQNVKPAIADFRFKSDNVLLPNGRTDSLKFKAGTSYKLYLKYDDREFNNSTTRKLKATFLFESGSGKISNDQFGQPGEDGLTFGDAPGTFDGDLLFVPDAPGVVRVKLQLSDGVKISDVPQASTTFFENLKPIPAFTIQLRNQTNPYEVVFDPSRSQDRDGTITQFIWTFGDDSTATAKASAPITHKYKLSNQYRVHLKVIDNEGKADSTEQFVSTANQPPLAALNVFPKSGKVPLEIAYSATGSFDPDGNISSYQVFFGDGATSQTPTGTHTFATDLNYQVLLIVKDNLGLADTNSVEVRVSTPPIAALKITPEAGGSIPLMLVVSGKESRDPHPAGSISTYRITVTNVATNAQLIFPQDSVTTRLTSPANYLITLDVTNNRGLTSRAEKVIPAGLLISPGIILNGGDEPSLPLLRKP